MFGRSKKKGAKEKAKKPKKEKKAKGKPKAKKAKAPKVPAKKRPTDIYAVMLLLSLGFVALACLFLFLELRVYDFPGNTTPWN